MVWAILSGCRTDQGRQLTHGFFTDRCLPRISPTVSVNAMLKVSINVTMSLLYLPLALRGSLLLHLRPSASRGQNCPLCGPVC